MPGAPRALRAPHAYWGRAHPEDVAEAERIEDDALRMLAQMRRGAPDDTAGWTLAIAILKSRKAKSAHRKLIDDFARAHPDDPAALRCAAEAASDRKAWDKARRFTRRWAAAQPFDPDIADFEARLLRLKAIAKLKAERPDVAADLINEARTIEGTSNGARVWLAAVAYVLQAGLADDAAAQRHRAAWASQPWLFESRVRAVNGALKRPVGDHVPDAAPTEEEWGALLSAAVELTSGLDLLCAAALRGTQAVQRLDDIQRLCRILSDGGRDEALYAAACEGQPRFPESAVLLIYRYQMALKLKRPKREFKGGLRPLVRARNALVIDDPLFSPAAIMQRQLAELVDEVRAYVKSGRRHNPTNRSAQARPSAPAAQLDLRLGDP